MSDIQPGIAETVAIRRRPVAVWLICALYLWSLGFNAVSLARLLRNGAMPDVASIPGLLLAAGYGLSLVTITATVFLFLLRKAAVPLFGVSCVVNVLLTTATVMTSNLASHEFGIAILIGTYAAGGFTFLVFLYARKLRASGVLT